VASWLLSDESILRGLCSLFFRTGDQFSVLSWPRTLPSREMAVFQLPFEASNSRSNFSRPSLGMECSFESCAIFVPPKEPAIFLGRIHNSSRSNCSEISPNGAISREHINAFRRDMIKYSMCWIYSHARQASPRLLESIPPFPTLRGGANL
jgi:hypothetical protein